MFLVGTIVGTFGNKGDVKITPLINPADYLLELNSIFVESTDSTKQELTVVRSKKHKNVYLFTLEGINDMDVAEDLCGLQVYVPSIEFKELQKNEYYYHELEGLTAYTESGKVIGKVDHIMQGGNDILVIKDDAGKEIMIPFADELVPEVNLKERTIIVNAINGLIT
ncbi:MAG: 16S rRNA processing protein RimM [Candidatus Melainabacteria bacterium]|nr:16S rRNA processing protein RimM [Candidatus Melainabacteria bacterium]